MLMVTNSPVIGSRIVMGAPGLRGHAEPELWFNLDRSVGPKQFSESMSQDSGLIVPIWRYEYSIRSRPRDRAARPTAGVRGVPTADPYTDIHRSTSASTMPARVPASTTCPRSITA